MSMPPPPPPGTVYPFSPVQERQFILPILIGELLTYTLFGAGLVQFISCWTRLGTSTQDRTTYWFLWLLFVADMADSICKAMFVCFHLSNALTGGLLGVIYMPSITKAVCYLDGFIAFLNVLVYDYRIWRLTPRRSWVVNGILGFATSAGLMQFISACMTTRFMDAPVAGWMTSAMLPWSITWMAASAVADVVLCATFVFQLRKHTSDFHQTNLIIAKWALLALETGLVPAITDIITLISLLVWPNKPYFLIAGLLLPKLHINCMLIVINAVLDARKSASEPSSFDPGHSAASGKLGFRSTRPGQQSGAIRSNPSAYQAGTGSYAQGITITSEVHYNDGTMSEGNMELNDYGEKRSINDNYGRHPFQGV